MQRRVLLAIGALALLASLAGCSAAGSIDLRAVNDTELADEASRSLDPDVPTGGATDRSRADVVRDAVANGSATVSGLRPPISQGLPFAVDGGYYDLNHTVVDRRTAHVVDVGVDFGETEPEGSVIDYADLPTPDRAALDRLLPPSEPASSGEVVGVSAVYSDADLKESVLADREYDVVAHEGERYALRVEEPRAETVRTYRYAATTVAPNATAYAAYLDSRYAFTLSGLGDDERSVVEEAIGGTYYADSTDDDAFASVLERFRAHDAITEDGGSGTWLVRYGDERYVADLYYGEFRGE